VGRFAWANLVLGLSGSLYFFLAREPGVFGLYVALLVAMPYLILVPVVDTLPGNRAFCLTAIVLLSQVTLFYGLVWNAAHWSAGLWFFVSSAVISLLLIAGIALSAIWKWLRSRCCPKFRQAHSSRS
jgi:hypothetical protein